MQDSIARKADEPTHDSDATSKETLADLEENKKSPDSESKPAGESQLPSPDGVVDEPTNIKDAGPM